MKKIITGVLALFALVVGIVIVVAQLSRSQPTETPVLVLEQGIVQYKLPATESYVVMASSEVNIPSGTFIKTNENSYARIFFPDNSLLSIDASSEIQVNFEGKKINIEQLIGKTWNRVQSLVEGGEYTVTTPNTIAAVRGTIFGVGVDDPDNSRVFVEESNVEVSKYDQKDGKRSILESQNLGKEELAFIKRNKEDFRIIKQITPQDIKDSLWYRRNKILDEEYLNLKGSIRGRDLRTKLKDRLEERGDFEDLKLGLRDVIDSTQLNDNDLIELGNIVKITERSCTEYSQAQIQASIDQIREYRRFIKSADKLEKLLVNLHQSCADGKFNLDEAQRMESLVKEFNTN